MNIIQEHALTDYVAFLRGINVGGHKIVPMTELKKAFEEIGFQNVKTFLASGNVIFKTGKASIAELEQKIENKLKHTFGFSVDSFARSVSSLQEMIKSNPFKGVKYGPKTRLYVTFFSDKPKKRIEIPYCSAGRSFRILGLGETAAFSACDLEKTKTTDGMKIIRNNFGESITTRNWDTILRIVKLFPEKND